ncbi:hypothetical protein ASPZODRAFT_135972 [Penicilliopsis zonata CBS 506.65]|uniref:Receptor L-domain domain-containing protein n=1 Tax=Penicilliopsis zonata CBS 506.65 TaxID=1073090 RepID=A0A1L9S8M6_9EURO|nr:hypothetical protein ASPZODRAFT_135972 [Penicilliopsis zonata CBS 506.65]OJJ43505.1 hypothetical protein ASPZODRAFT_135972 [Penicilliopsis zonata CBS 506.65]
MISHGTHYFAIGVLLAASAAADCLSGSTVVVDSQTALAAALADCTTFGRKIEIDSSFSGAASFAGVTNLSAAISTNLSVPGLTEILLPDVVQGYNFIAGSTPRLRNFSAPRMTDFLALRLDTEEALTVDIPLITAIDSIDVGGKTLYLNFPMLENITGMLSLDNEVSSAEPFAVDFPLLRTATEIVITGTVSNIYLPRLKSAYSATQIGNSGDAIALDLPRLSEVTGGLAIGGNFSSISLPSLVETNATISISASSPLSLNFTSLVKANTIEITGNVTDVYFPQLTSANRIYISSSLDVNCTGYDQAAAQSSLNTSDGSSGCYGSSTTVATPAAGHSGLAEIAKIGVGVGVGLGGFIILAAVAYFFCLRGRK